LIPPRADDRRKLLAGAGIVVLVSLLNLAPVSLGVFGAPWPLALLWAACGWLSLGPNAGVALLLLLLGLFLDWISAAPLGAWAFCGLITHIAGLAQHRFIVRLDADGPGQALICGVTMVIAGLFVSLLLGQPIASLAMIVPVLTGTLLYGVVARWFVFERQG
jgi:hypothetical protein